MNINGKVVVIGDTHGDFEKTKQMLGVLTKEKILDDRWIVFIGDYVDQGPDTSKLLSLLISFRKYHKNSVFLCGNHDLNLAKALNLIPNPHQSFYWNRIPERNRTVLSSYQANNGTELNLKMPNEHKEFLTNLPWFAEHPNYIFVHSGIDPNEPLNDQLYLLKQRNPNIFRPKWLYSNTLGQSSNKGQTDKLIISGHMNITKPVYFDNRVIIDTGAGYGGKLTGLLLPEMRLIQV